MNDDRRLPDWDGKRLAALLELERVGGGAEAAPATFQNTCGDRNAHNRAYGGSVLGQALLAASYTVPKDRAVTMIQFLFLNGSFHDQPISFDVTALQDGKRFSGRHVRGTQEGGRTVLDAQVSFAVPMPAPAHAVAPTPYGFAKEIPEMFPRLSDVSENVAKRVRDTLGYMFVEKEGVDFRIPEPDLVNGLNKQDPRFRFWLKVDHKLPNDAYMHAAAFAYISDWWLNFTSVGSHIEELERERKSLYIASLNHSIWLHRPFLADDWLHFDCESPAAAHGRSLTFARVHNSAGQLVASATQECIMAHGD